MGLWSVINGYINTKIRNNVGLIDRDTDHAATTQEIFDNGYGFAIESDSLEILTTQSNAAIVYTAELTKSNGIVTITGTVSNTGTVNVFTNIQVFSWKPTVSGAANQWIPLLGSAPTMHARDITNDQSQMTQFRINNVGFYAFTGLAAGKTYRFSLTYAANKS